MKLYEKTLERNDIFDGHIIKVHNDRVLLENGKEGFRECVDHPGGVCVAVITPANEVLMVRQFRYPYGEVVFELPAGKLEKGEDPFNAIKREQLEETGTTGTNYTFLGDLYPSPGYTNEIIRIWCCDIDGDSHSQDLDEDEFLEVERIPLREALRMVAENKIPDAKSQVGIMKTALLKGISL